MQSIFHAFNDTGFWSEKFWLPRNEHWEDFDAPHLNDFVYGILAAVVLCFLRMTLYRYVLTPIGLYNGLKPEKVHRAPYVPLLESYYRFRKRPSCEEMLALSKKLDTSFTKVSKWFRVRRNSTKFPVIVKFVESGWKFFFYFSLFSYGCYCLHQEPFLYDTSEFFRAYPHHKMSQYIFWYYMIELAYYLTGLIWVFLEVKRKDFVVMVTHHVVTVMLISFSYVTNYFRIGTVVMFLHDASDFWLEAAKMFKYVGSFWPCMGCFCVFILVWIVTRLYCFPFRVIASVFFEAPGLIGRYPALDMFAAFLSVLQVLHIFWTIQIIRTAVKPFTTGQLTSDARSDSEMSETDNDHTHASDLSLRNDHCNGGAQNGITRSE